MGFVLESHRPSSRDQSRDYRLIDFRDGLSSEGAPYLKLLLENSEERISGFMWGGVSSEQLNCAELAALRTQGVRRTLSKHGCDILTVTRIEEIEADDSLTSVLLLPRSYAVESEMLDRLSLIVQQITNAGLARFCNDVFSDLDIALPFLRLPASRDSHHHQPGGLLRHSVECAELIAKGNPRTLTPMQRQIALVGALFHDVGKVRTLATPVNEALYIGHDQRTLELMATPLKRLDVTEHRIAEELRHIWTWHHTLPKRDPETPAAWAVIKADRKSAKADGRDNARLIH